MNRSISIPEWHQLAESGTALPVRIQLNGSSMAPLIRINHDYVTVIPLKETPIAGDIVLFFEPRSDRYIVHRVWDVQNGQILRGKRLRHPPLPVQVHTAGLKTA